MEPDAGRGVVREMKKGKIVLVYPEFLLKDGPAFLVPMNLLHLGTYASSQGYEVRLIDCNNEDSYLDLIAEEARDSLLVGITSMTAQLPTAVSVARHVKKVLKGAVPIVFGGAHATLFPESLVEHPDIDFSVIGEGELTLVDLAGALSSGTAVSEVEGLACLQFGAARRRERTTKFNFSDMPHIRYDLLKAELVRQFPERSVSVLTSRGCPHRCTFCIDNIVKEYNKWRAWDAERVADEIEYVQTTYGVRRVWFWDENFFVSKRRTREILAAVKKRNLKFEWSAEIRADYFRDSYINDNLAREIREAGCIKLGLGAESGSQEILDFLKKDMRVENIVRSAATSASAGIEPTYSFMIGLPEETPRDILGTVSLIRRLLSVSPRVKILGPQLFRPYPGGSLFDECVKSGWKPPQNVEEWVETILRDSKETDPFKSPWIRHPRLVNTVWFYSLLLCTSEWRLLSMYLEYARLYGKRLPMKVLGGVGIVVMSALGKLRMRLNFHLFPIEVRLLRKYRATLSS